MFQPVIARLGIRYINRRFFQSLLFILGVAIGVAVVIAIDIANDSAGRAFNLSAQSITGRATHRIIDGTGSGLPDDLYRQIRLDLGIRDSAPIISETVRALNMDDTGLRLLGVDPFAEPPFRDYLSTINVLGENDSDSFEALTTFIAEPDTVLISETLAQRYDKQPGDMLLLRAGVQRTEVRIIGLLQPQDTVSQQALDDLILADIATAGEITGMSGRLTRIDLILPDDADLTQIRTILPTGARLEATGSSGDNALAQMTEAFEINLQALSLLAVVVGVFLIYNTVSFSVVQRRPTIGIMRSLGTTRRQIFSFIVGEAFILGVMGTILGMGLGVIFGRLMVGLVAQTITDLYFSVTVTSITVAPFTLVKAAVIGIAASTGAAILPSYDATRTPPTGSMKRSQYEEQTQRLLPLITAVAAGSFIIGLLLLQIPPDALPLNSLFVSFGALFCIIFGGALFTPLFLTLSMRAVTPLTARLFGVVGRMAPRAVNRALSRTGVAVAALTIAVSVIVGVSVMIGSFRNTVSDWLGNTLGADIFISPPVANTGEESIDTDPAVRDIVQNTPGIDRVSASRAVRVLAPDYPDMLPVNLLVVDFEIADQRDFVWKDFEGETANPALEAGQIVVSEPFAYRRDINPQNNQLTLLTDSGEITFEVAGVFYDYTTDQGRVLMARDTYEQHFDDPFITSLAAYVEPGTEIAPVIEQLRSELAGYDLDIQSNRVLREGVFEIFERTFQITIALRLLATLVAFIGILSALMALQLENTRQYGVMRANGMSRRQLRNFTLIQTGLMGTVAGVLAIPIGIVLAMVLIYVINVRSFGWTMQFMIPPQELITAFAVALVAAMLAGIYPALRLSSMLPAKALRSE